MSAATYQSVAIDENPSNNGVFSHSYNKSQRFMKGFLLSSGALFLLTLLFGFFSNSNIPYDIVNSVSIPSYGDEYFHKSPNDPRIYKSLLLPNDLEVLLISDPQTDKSSASLSVNVGAWQDPDDSYGLAHFLEHMLFMGTKKYPSETSYEIYLSAHAGMSNAFTADEFTVYFFDINAEFFPQMLDQFAQFFISPLLSEAGALREMNAVDSEHRKNIHDDEWFDITMLQSSDIFLRSTLNYSNCLQYSNCSLFVSTQAV
jgi:hypothetical protein